MSNLDKHILAYYPPKYASGQFKDYRVLEKLSISDTLLDENDDTLVFVTIWDCWTHVHMTSLVQPTDLDFKISVALVPSFNLLSLTLPEKSVKKNWEKEKWRNKRTNKLQPDTTIHDTSAHCPCAY